MNPTNWEWCDTTNNELTPRMTDNEVEPANLLKIICCDCKKSDNLCGVAACVTCHSCHGCHV